MAVREFDGAGDMITCSQGGVTGDLTAASFSVLVLAYPITTAISGRPFVTTGVVGSADVNGFYDNGVGGEVGLGGDAGDAYSGGTGVYGLATGVWQIFGVTRASGATPTPRFHRKNLNTGNWVHRDATGTHAMIATSPTAVRFGKWCNAAMDANMDLALVAIWKGTLLSDAQYEAIEAAETTASILALSPTALWEFNQASTGTAVVDLVGSANETSLVGTTVVTSNNPPYWAFNGQPADASPRYISSAGTNYGVGGSATANVPVGTQDGDQMIMWIIRHGSENSRTTTGWTFVDTEGIGAWALDVYRRVASSEPSSYTFVATTAHEGQVWIATYRGLTWDSYQSAQTASAITNPETPSITPSVNNCFVLGLFGAGSNGALNSATPDTSPACIERQDFVEFGSASLSYLEDYTQTTATTTSLGCVANAASTDVWGAFAISLKPSAVAAEKQSYYATRRRVGR